MRLIGHRGALGLAPENTVRSFVRACEVGVDEVELDLRLSADGELVILHDATVDRTTDGTGDIATKTLAQIRKLDAGDGQAIPTFDEVLDAIGEMPVQAEIKALEAVGPFVEAATRRELAGRVTVTSFSDEMLAAARRSAPRIPRALIVSEPTDIARRAAAVDAEAICLRIPHGGPADAERARAAGLRVLVWPVNDVEAADRARDMGAEAVTTDRPDLLQPFRGGPGTQPAGTC